MDDNRSARHALALRRGLFALSTLLFAGVQPALGSHTCPTPQPSFSYIDADNDGCHTSGVDSASIDAQLQAASTPGGGPSFVGPPGTGVVIPRALALPADANPYWSVANDVWIDGPIKGASELKLEAGGTTYLDGSIKIKARGVPNEGNVTLGCLAGCGPTVVAGGVKLASNGHFVIYDAQLGDDVRAVVRCAPGHDPGCGGSFNLRRPTAVGHRLRVVSKGGIDFRDGAAPLVIGDDVLLRTGANSADGGVIGFPILLILPGGVSIGANARLSAGGGVSLDADPTSGPSAPIAIGPGSALAGVDVVLIGSSVDVGAASALTGKVDLGFQATSSVVVTATDGSATVGSDTRLSGGTIRISAQAGSLIVDTGVRAVCSGGSQRIELSGSSVTVDTGTRWTKSTTDSRPISVTGASSVSIASSSLVGAGLDVSVSDPGASITFVDDSATGSAGSVAAFSAPGACDLTGSTFGSLALDVSGCGSVIGP
jgi:hypothetical protein